MPPSVFFPLRTYRFALFFLLGALICTFYRRANHFDDAWFAEQSYWLVRDGWVRSEFFRGYNGWGDRIYVFHKLFIYTGALFMQLTGFSLAASKLLTILCGSLTGWLIWTYNRRNPREQQWLAVLLYFGCGTIIRYFCINRPEIMCMMLGFASFYALDQPGEKTVPKAILAGILAGLAALTHLNGLIYLVAGAGWLLLRTGWRSVIGFSFAGGLTLSLYVLDALADGNMDKMLMQFVDDPATQSSFQLVDKLFVMLSYHQIFFHSHGEVPLSVLVLVCLILFRRRLRLTQPVLLYFLLLFVSFWLLSKSNFDFYYILFVPWLVLLAAHCLITYPTQQPRQRATLRVFLVIYFSISLVSLGKVFAENGKKPYIETYNSKLAQYMPLHHTKVIAPLSFFFGQIENYQIQGFTYFHLLELRGTRYTLSSFFDLAERNDVQYIISDDSSEKGFKIPFDAPAHIGAFERVFQDQYTSLYARRQTAKE